MCSNETTPTEATVITPTQRRTLSSKIPPTSLQTEIIIDVDTDDGHNQCRRCNLSMLALREDFSGDSCECTCACTSSDSSNIDCVIEDGWNDSGPLLEGESSSDLSAASSTREDGEEMPEEKEEDVLLTPPNFRRRYIWRGISEMPAGTMKEKREDGYCNRLMVCRRYPIARRNSDLLEDVEKGVESQTPTPVVVPQHEQLVVFGCDISRLPPTAQFLICAGGLFSFSIVYGYLQELLSVHIAGRKYALFLATCQFAGYTFWSYVLTSLRSFSRWWRRGCARGREQDANIDCDEKATENDLEPLIHALKKNDTKDVKKHIPMYYYIGLSLIRATDLAMTNLAMQYLNYPAKTIIRSSKVAFTMLLGIIIGRKRYGAKQFFAVGLIVAGLCFFLHADATGDALFHPFGVMMLVVSLTCDGSLSNWSEVLMAKYSVGQDEFLLRLYSVALIAMTCAAYAKGELLSGARLFFLLPGTVPEIEGNNGASNDETAFVWTAWRKIFALLLFSTTGLFASSFAGAITKRFGALAMSITSTTRKATTMFLSFALFPNRCTVEHVFGMVVFLIGLLMKSLCARTSPSTVQSETTDKIIELEIPLTADLSGTKVKRRRADRTHKLKQSFMTAPDVEVEEDEMVPLNGGSLQNREMTKISA